MEDWHAWTINPLQLQQLGCLEELPGTDGATGRQMCGPNPKCITYYVVHGSRGTSVQTYFCLGNLPAQHQVHHSIPSTRALELLGSYLRTA